MGSRCLVSNRGLRLEQPEHHNGTKVGYLKSPVAPIKMHSRN